jgi:transposase
MGELLVLPEDMRAKQWVAQAGLDPRQSVSGTSVNKKPRISKAGNRYLRLALYMPALSAARHDPHVQGYYRHLIENRGLKKIQAICAVMRKLLHAIHGMLKTRQPFEGSRFYALAATPA